MPDDKFATQGDEVPSTVPTRSFKPRKYQLEMLEQSLRQNIIIALDTGAGKTHIAVLRMKHEIEGESRKVCASSLYAAHCSVPHLLVLRTIYASIKYSPSLIPHRSPGSSHRQSR
jgi:hypothetical protein